MTAASHLPPPLRQGEWTDPEIPDDTASGEPAAQGGQLTVLQGGTLGAFDQARAAFGHAFRTGMLRSRDLAEREGGMVHGLLRAQPPSVAGQHQYAKSRAWVPPGHDGGWADRAGTVYHAVLGRPGVAAGNLVSALFARPLRLFLALIVLTAAYFLITNLF